MHQLLDRDGSRFPMLWKGLGQEENQRQRRTGLGQSQQLEASGTRHETSGGTLAGGYRSPKGLFWLCPLGPAWPDMLSFFPVSPKKSLSSLFLALVVCEASELATCPV